MSKSKLKLLWITENYYPNRGGMAQSCDRITHTLRKLKVYIDIIHLTSRKKAYKTEKTVQGTYTSFPFSEDSAHTLNRVWNHISNPKNKKIYTYIVAFGGNQPILSAPIFAKWLNIPLVTLLRGNDFDLSILSAKKRDNLLYALNNSSLICSVSDDKISKIKAVTNNKNIHYIPNGIDLNSWQLTKSDILNANKWKKNNVNSNKKIIGLFGHLKQKKGFDFLLQSIEYSGSANKIHLLITGEASEESIENLKKTQISYNLLPFLDRYELLPYYYACDAVAIPSFYDGMPNVLLEAGILKIPIIASNIDGMKDVLNQIDSWLLFHPGDIEQCANVINRFIYDKNEQLLTLSEKLQNNLIKNYTDIIEAKRYEHLFNNIIDYTLDGTIIQ